MIAISLYPYIGVLLCNKYEKIEPEPEMVLLGVRDDQVLQERRNFNIYMAIFQETVVKILSLHWRTGNILDDSHLYCILLMIAQP